MIFTSNYLTRNTKAAKDATTTLAVVDANAATMTLSDADRTALVHASTQVETSNVKAAILDGASVVKHLCFAVFHALKTAYHSAVSVGKIIYGGFASVPDDHNDISTAGVELFNTVKEIAYAVDRALDTAGDLACATGNGLVAVATAVAPTISNACGKVADKVGDMIEAALTPAPVADVELDDLVSELDTLNEQFDEQVEELNEMFATIDTDSDVSTIFDDQNVSLVGADNSL